MVHDRIAKLYTMRTKNILRNHTSELSDEERAVLEGAIARTQTYPAGHIVIPQNVPVTVSTLLVEGLVTRHVDASDGRRHLVAVHVPGDFVDLHAYALKRLDHDLGALTDITVAVFEHEELERLQVRYPHLTRRLWFLTLLDAALHRQWIVRLASLNALQRVAHFLCEMNGRLIAIGASDGRVCRLPMTQADIGEVCGLTHVHVNRVLRELRERGLCSLRSFRLEIMDLPGLVEAGLFAPDYLYLNRETSLRAVGRFGDSNG